MLRKRIKIAGRWDHLSEPKRSWAEALEKSREKDSNKFYRSLWEQLQRKGDLGPNQWPHVEKLMPRSQNAAPVVVPEIPADLIRSLDKPKALIAYWMNTRKPGRNETVDSLRTQLATKKTLTLKQWMFAAKLMGPDSPDTSYIVDSTAKTADCQVCKKPVNIESPTAVEVEEVIDFLYSPYGHFVHGSCRDTYLIQLRRRKIDEAAAEKKHEREYNKLEDERAEQYRKRLIDQKVEDAKAKQQKVLKQMRQYAKERFEQALGDPTKWKFTGKVIDRGERDGVCICGVKIRYEFYISEKGRPKKQEVVGSECIYRFRDINPELFRDLDRARIEFEAELADRKKEQEVREDIDEIKKQAAELLDETQTFENAVYLAEGDPEIDRISDEYRIAVKALAVTMTAKEPPDNPAKLNKMKTMVARLNKIYRELWRARNLLWHTLINVFKEKGVRPPNSFSRLPRLGL